MIEWGEERRNRDPGYFCRLTIEMSKGHQTRPIWIISDARRPSDIDYFRQNYSPLLTIRVEANDETRRRRGWIFTGGIDDAPSECALDHFTKWDMIVENNGDDDARLQSHLDSLLEMIDRCRRTK